MRDALPPHPLSLTPIPQHNSLRSQSGQLPLDTSLPRSASTYSRHTYQRAYQPETADIYGPAHGLDRGASQRSAAPSINSSSKASGTPHWWQLNTSRDTAHLMLQGLPDGAFLIRRSDRIAKVWGVVAETGSHLNPPSPILHSWSSPMRSRAGCMTSTWAASTRPR